jgi:hypothetical protein
VLFFFYNVKLANQVAKKENTDCLKKKILKSAAEQNDLYFYSLLLWHKKSLWAKSSTQVVNPTCKATTS